MRRGTTIPNVFHFVFGLKDENEHFHLMYYLCLLSCIEVNRPDEVYFHYYHEPHGVWWQRIKPKLSLRKIDPEKFVSDYLYEDCSIASFRYAHLADFARLKILLEEGGFYADIDTLFLKPIPSAWYSRQFILGHEEVPSGVAQDGSLCNAWIGSARNSDFCRLWLEHMYETFDGSWSNHSTLLPYRLSRRYTNLIDLEPKVSFYALDWTPRGINDIFLRAVSLPENAYSLHLWKHLWFEKNRTDFSHFHGDLLTVDYVSYANTTYANNARGFLPQDFVGSRSRYWRQAVSSVARHPFRSALLWL